MCNRDSAAGVDVDGKVAKACSFRAGSPQPCPDALQWHDSFTVYMQWKLKAAVHDMTLILYRAPSRVGLKVFCVLLPFYEVLSRPNSLQNLLWTPWVDGFWVFVCHPTITLSICQYANEPACEDAGDKH